MVEIFETVEVRDRQARLLLQAHDLGSGATHTNLDPRECVCRVPSFVLRPTTSSGNSCASCGGITQQTGTCYTCRECGDTGGCG